jgi:paraquat-inducible protein B
MKTKFSPTVVGAFVLGALILTVIAVITMGSMHLFSTPGRFVAYFNESVQGLDLGSAVKLRGVRVGEVKEVEVRYDHKTRTSKVAVMCELDENRIADGSGAIIKITEPEALQKLVNDGLRAKMRLTGITGSQIIELDFYDSQRYPAPPGNSGEAKYTVIPTIPSEFTEFATSASEILKNLKQMDLGGLRDESIKTLQQLGDASASVQRLTDYLERNPNAVITGKKPPPTK